MAESDRLAKRFHHVGLRAIEPQPDEDFVSSTKVWVTDPNKHPFRIEYLRYEPDSPLPDAFKDSPHVAYEVDDIDAHLEGKEFAIPPFDVGDPPFSRVAFTWEDGLVIEYMQFKPHRSWFDR